MYDRDIQIEKRLSCLETKMDELLNNHLVHLQNRVDKIQWLLITNLIAVIFILAEQLLK